LEQQSTEAELGQNYQQKMGGDLTGPDSRRISAPPQPGGWQLQLMAPVGEEAGSFASGLFGLWNLERWLSWRARRRADGEREEKRALPLLVAAALLRSLASGRRVLLSRLRYGKKPACCFFLLCFLFLLPFPLSFSFFYFNKYSLQILIVDVVNFFIMVDYLFY
jgi:hypothetical protein